MTTSISPATIAAVVGGASIAVLPANPSRVGVYIFNASAVTIWVCPSTGPQTPANPGGQPFPAVVSGAGCIALATQTGIMLGAPNLPAFTNGLNAIAASGSNNPLSLWEYYH